MVAQDYIYETTEVTIEIQGMFFKARNIVPIDFGWREGDDKYREAMKAFPKFREGEQVTFFPIAKDGYTKEPARLTEAALGGQNGLMDKLNLGTAATRAEIIKTLIARGYVQVEKTKLYPTDKGVLLYECTKHTLLGKPEMTKIWEEALERIGESGDAAVKRQQSFLESIRAFCRSASDHLKAIEIPKDLTQRVKDNGVKRIGDYTISETKQKYIVTGKGGTFDISKRRAGKTLTPAQLRLLLEKGRTGVIKGFRARTGKTFSACLVFHEDEVSMEYENGE